MLNSVSKNKRTKCITIRVSRTVCSAAFFVLAATLAQNTTPQTAAALCVKFFSPQRRYLFDKGRCWLDFRESFRCLLFSSDAVAAFRARPFFIENRGAL